MANDVTNILTVKGDRAGEFVNQCKGKDLWGEDVEFTFNSLVPIGGKFTDNKIARAWGTNKDAYCMEEGDIKVYSDKARIQFDTAWTPPRYWLEKVAKLYPDLHFELIYDEINNFQIGQIVLANGELLEHWQADGLENYLQFNKEVLGRDTSWLNDFFEL